MTQLATNMPEKSAYILIADDDPDDRFMACEALKLTGSPPTIITVNDGEDLMDYLYRRGKYLESLSPHPDLILLDLNMPRKDGFQALREIKSDPDLKSIPVVVLTTSKEEEDVNSSYALGVNSFITKPVHFDSLVNAMKVLGKYWFEIVKLPTERTAS